MDVPWGRAVLTTGLVTIMATSCLCATTRSALASEVAVSPVNIYLTRDAHTALLTLTNQGNESASFQISVYAWNQSDAAATQLTSTSDVVLFPTLLTLGPGEQRKVRIGATITPGLIEKTYRVLIQELPPPRTQATSPGLHVRLLTNISLPLFLEPDKPRLQTTISEASVKRGELFFRVNNLGSMHVLPQSVAISGKDSAGKLIFSRQPRLWYILAGESNKVGVILPAYDCSAVRTLEISVQTQSESVTQVLTTPSGVCAR